MTEFTPQRFTAVEMLDRLVAFDTTSRLSNLALIAFVQDYLSGWGVESLVIPNEDNTKASLYATIGPKDRGGIALSGHTDVVPVEGQDWHTDPFTLTEREGKLYGRGSCDMKGFVAAALAHVPDFLDRDLRQPIHLALSYDEEVGCLGVRPMIAEIAARHPLPRAVIVGEPTMMTVVDAHKGTRRFRTDVTGREAHSSMPQLAVNAVMVAGELVAELARLSRELRDRGDPSGRFEPAYTTLQVGRIEGGGAQNIIPRHCHFFWEMRLLPSADPNEIPRRFDAFADELMADMRAVDPEAGIVTSEVGGVVALKPDAGSEAERLALFLSGTNQTFAVSYATEGGLFQEAAMSAIVCGPGDIAQAHQPNEFITLQQMEKCSKFMLDLADYASKR
ncbi:acetylornithine deacetylase [Rhodoligotrophos appendicifer]|uniref:acetylornithine deacetylase n=1 Tax=Rhodoligotrophos appendicifer TaxID=987056 RepID=UPI0024821B48|nr:acetylornithine deacetylase [Rhodoligotrophos appendicifer]